MNSAIPGRPTVAQTLLFFAAVVLCSFAWSTDASALPCLEDKFGTKTQCTANDIRITDIVNVVVAPGDGCDSQDDTVTFSATLVVKTTATARYDIGTFIGTDGAQALHGECSVHSIPTAPVPPYVNIDKDQCGDSSSSATLEVPISNVTVACSDTNENNQLDIFSCTSWHQNPDGVCSGAADVAPGTGSKCNCPTTPTDIPIFVPDPVCTNNAECQALATGCSVGVCDVSNPGAGAFGCVFSADSSQCNDGNVCNGVEACVCAADTDCSSASCTNPADLNCNDGITCTVDTCDPTSGCSNQPDNSACGDNNVCDGGDTCDPQQGCVDGTPLDCDDGVTCTNDSCDAISGCAHVPDNSLCNDSNVCNGVEECTLSGCTNPADLDCNDDVVCTADSCNPASGCVNEPNNAVCGDSDPCTGEEFCDPNGGCTAGTALDCDDANACTEDVCGAGGCQHLEICEGAICRTAGFWSTHGGSEKGGQNVTQEVLTAVGGVDVCGVHVSTTGSGSLASALEALCVSVEGEAVRQLFRQLVAAALNCAITATGDCDTIVFEHTEISFDECSTLCAGGDVGVDGPTIGECIAQLDCFNNGGEIVNGDCATGSCSITGALCGPDFDVCPDVILTPQTCDPFPGNCHGAELCSNAINVCFEGGPASSPRACKGVQKNTCTIDSCN